MLPFFRKLRKRYADDNLGIKYLRYAIGEIILVVLGILIALQINNSNETRKKMVEFTRLIEEIKEETGSNIDKTKHIIDYYLLKDSIINLIMNDQLIFENYENNSQLFFAIQESEGIEIFDNGFENLMINSENIPKKFQPIIKDLKQLYGLRKNRMVEDYKKMVEEETSFRKYMSENFSWFSNTYKVGKSPDTEAILFYLNNPIYKNFVYRYHNNAIINFLNSTIKYHIEAKKIFDQLAQILNYGELNGSIIDPNCVFNENIKGVYEGNWYGNKDTMELILEDNKFYMIYGGQKLLMNFLSRNSFLTEVDNYLYRIHRTNNGDLKSITYPNGTSEPSEYIRVK